MVVMQQAVLYRHPKVESFDTEITCAEYHQEKKLAPSADLVGNCQQHNKSHRRDSDDYGEKVYQHGTEYKHGYNL